MTPSSRWLAIAGLVATGACVAAAGPASASPVIRTGYVKVAGTIMLTGVAASATLSCSVYISTYDSVNADDQGITAGATCTRSGQTATISALVPYKFIYDSSDVGAASLAITASVSSSSPDVSGSTESNAIVPASGTTIPFPVNLAL